MKRLTRQRRHGQGRSPLFWGGLSLAVLLLAATMAWLERADRMDLPDVSDEKSGKLLFYDALKQPDREGAEAMPFVPKGETPLKPSRAEPNQEARPKPAPSAVKSEPPPKPSPPAVRAQSPPAEKAETPTPSARERRFAVQVAASKDRKAAEDLKDRLVENGYPGYLLKEDVPGKGIWYRVRVGPFDEMDEARKMILRIKEQAKLAGYLVVEKRAID